MLVSVQDISSAFADLLANRRTREEIARWAAELRSSDDDTPLEYVPPSAEAAIWRALEFLMGIDLRDGPDTYLHTLDDVRVYWNAHESQFLLERKSREP